MIVFNVCHEVHHTAHFAIVAIPIPDDSPDQKMPSPRDDVRSRSTDQRIPAREEPRGRYAGTSSPSSGYPDHRQGRDQKRGPRAPPPDRSGFSQGGGRSANAAYFDRGHAPDTDVIITPHAKAKRNSTGFRQTRPNPDGPRAVERRRSPRTQTCGRNKNDLYDIASSTVTVLHEAIGSRFGQMPYLIMLRYNTPSLAIYDNLHAPPPVQFFRRDYEGRADGDRDIPFDFFIIDFDVVEGPDQGPRRPMHMARRQVFSRAIQQLLRTKCGGIFDPYAA